MPPKKVVCKVILQALTFSFLLSCFIYFFMIDQMVTFMKGRTTITRRVENVNSVEFPTITICFDPATKLSIAKKYGFENPDDKFNQDIPNKTLPQVFDEMSYGFDEDYFIRNYNGQTIHLGLNEIDAFGSTPTVKMQFQVEALRIFNSGTCIKLEPRFEMISMSYKLRLSIQLSPSIIGTKDKIDSVRFIFTSNSSWINISGGRWPQFKPLIANVDLIREYTHLILQPEEEYFKDGKDSSADCLKDLYERQNCSYPCYASTIPGLPFCRTTKDFNCVKHVFTNQEFLNCLMTKKATYYSLNERKENPYHKDPNTLKTDVYIGINAMQKVVKEEVFVLTLQDLIGSVGGSLGLFFGFSFSAVLFSFFNKLFQSVPASSVNCSGEAGTRIVRFYDSLDPYCFQKKNL